MLSPRSFSQENSRAMTTFCILPPEREPTLVSTPAARMSNFWKISSAVVPFRFRRKTFWGWMFPNPSSAFSEKYGYVEGDTVTLKEEFGEEVYDFKVAGVYDYPVSIAMFMPREYFNEVFDQDEDYFTKRQCFEISCTE